ncbi:MAG: hypothetical protein AAB268_11640 [Elusimicrobiota bacterium]
MGGLNAAANEQIPTGGQGFNGVGQGGAGANDKPGGGGGPAGSKSVGESLAFIEAKERMMENLKLEFEKRKLKDPELLLYAIRNDSIKAIAAEMTKSLAKHITDFMDPDTHSDDSWVCEGGYSPRKSTPPCSTAAGTTPRNCMSGDRWYDYDGKSHSCVKKKGSSAGSGKETETAAPDLTGVGAVCTRIDENLREGKSSGADSYFKDDLRPAAKNTEDARNSLIGGDSKCTSPAPAMGVAASQMLNDAKAMLYAAPGIGNNATVKDAIGRIIAGVNQTGGSEAEDAVTALTAATNKINEATARINEGEKVLGSKVKEVPSFEDINDKKEVTKAQLQVTIAYDRVTEIIRELRQSAKQLEDEIVNITPLVKIENGKPIGILPDQNDLNKALDHLMKDAGPSVASIPDGSTKAQTEASQALGDLQNTITKNTDKDFTADKKAKAVRDKREAAKKAVTAAQEEVKDQATKLGIEINKIEIKGAQ